MIEFIPRVKDWDSRKDVAMALVEIKRLLDDISVVLSNYISRCKENTATGAGLSMDLIASFNDTLPSCYPIVNGLKESMTFSDTADYFEHSSEILDDFLLKNMARFYASQHKAGPLSKIMDLLFRIKDALRVSARRIREIVLYRP